MSAPSAMELTDGEERPEWCSEGVWPLLKREMILLRAGVVKISVAGVAVKFGVEIGNVMELLRKKKWRKQVENFREEMAQKCMIAAERVSDSLVTDLDDEEKLAKTSLRDKTIMVKQLSENVLNLSNGVVGSPAIGISFNDAKVLLGTAIEKPVVVEKKA